MNVKQKIRSAKAHMLAGIVALSAISVFLMILSGCSGAQSKPDDTLPQQLGEHVTVSAALPEMSDSVIPVYTAEIGMDDIQDYIDALFNESQSASVSIWEDGTYAASSPADRMYLHPDLSGEYYLMDDTLESPMIFYNYSLLLSNFGFMDDTDTQPAGAHYSYLPNSLQTDEELTFQSMADAQAEADNKMKMLEGYTEGAYRAEIVTSDALRSIYEQFGLSSAVEADPSLTITDEWFNDAGGYRFFYRMNVGGLPVYSDSKLLNSQTTADGAQIICPAAETMTTKEGMIYAFINAPIWNIAKSKETVTRVGLSVASEAVATYFDGLTAAEDTKADLYAIQLEYAACRNEEAVTLQPVYAFYYTQGASTGCILVNAQSGELL